MLQEMYLPLKMVPMVSGFDFFFISLLWLVVAWTFTLVRTMYALCCFFLQYDHTY